MSLLSPFGWEGRIERPSMIGQVVEQMGLGHGCH